MRAAILLRLRRASATGGRDRHELLVDAFIRTAELAQGIADAEFELTGADRRTDLQQASARPMLALAIAVDRSWQSGFRDCTGLTGIAAMLSDLELPSSLTTRVAEGYAHYALYPESYLEAAHRSPLGPGTCVIGIRSIGLGLAALVAAALGARPPVSLRPVGHPFAREVRADRELVDAFLADGQARFAVVDEGPGLSGSSFAAVTGWLEALGVAPERIHLFPSHAGPPGKEAGAAARQAWCRHVRHPADFDSSILSGPGGGLSAWLATLVGPHRMSDVSGGRWRSERFGCPSEFPACDPRLERRKYLLRCEGGAWIARFAGLGEIGRRKLHMGRRLHQAGFGPETAGLCHGFLIQKWEVGRPLGPDFPRPRLLSWLGAYLGARARLFPARAAGDSPGRLAEMAIHNTGQALGVAAAESLRRRLAPDRLPPVRPVAIDGRLHDFEFVVLPDGGLIKTDSVDHCQGHDLVGCQDMAWDVAGAIVEHRLTPSEASKLCRSIAHNGGHPVARELVEFYLPCYLAFQLGLWTMAASAAAGDEKHRQEALLARYSTRLTAVLRSSGPMEPRPGAS